MPDAMSKGRSAQRYLEKMVREVTEADEKEEGPA
jgi:hypothetical protein